MARVLVAFECSGRVREAFRRAGHDAVSCDLQPSETPGPHIQGDALPVMREPWDLVIAHPPCTRLSSLFLTGATRGSPTGRYQDHPAWSELPDALRVFQACLNANAPRICVENPRPHKAAREGLAGVPGMGYASCEIQPWHHGHPYTKRTLLWLRGLPPLMPTRVVAPLHVWYDRGSSKRPRERRAVSDPKDAARTFEGVAEAMADQWGTML